jgi:hypothetical protein
MIDSRFFEYLQILYTSYAKCDMKQAWVKRELMTNNLISTVFISLCHFLCSIRRA